MLELYADQEDPAYAVEWTDRAGNLIDFSSYDSFELKLKVVDTGEVILVKTSGFTAPTPVEGQPNLVASWAVNELNIPSITAPTDVYLILKAFDLTRMRPFRPGHPEVARIFPAA